LDLSVFICVHLWFQFAFAVLTLSAFIGG
jgi:hypothetical protein